MARPGRMSKDRGGDVTATNSKNNGAGGNDPAGGGGGVNPLLDAASLFGEFSSKQCKVVSCLISHSTQFLAYWGGQNQSQAAAVAAAAAGGAGGGGNPLFGNPFGGAAGLGAMLGAGGMPGGGGGGNPGGGGGGASGAGSAGGN